MMKVSRMTRTIPDILSRIVEHKRDGLGVLRARLPELERAAEARAASRRDFHAALLGRTPAMIAEIKKASPSKGMLASAVDPAALARAYQRGGAAALSVLTDEQFFQGNLGDLEIAREAAALPVLRKDFTLEEAHVVEAAAAGADAVLLIAAILTARELRRLRQLASRFGMAALVEVHDEEELEAALDAGAEIIGVNNRNLHTFDVDLATSIRLAGRIPNGIVKVSESGIHSADDVARLRAAGFQAFLVGEHLMRAPDPEAALRALLS
jgi:indole-3-glycerol phosphate synthase